MMGKQSLHDVHELLAANRHVEAASLLGLLARGGDPTALGELGNWRIAGNIIRRDLTAARSLIGQAAVAGDQSAQRLYASMLACGVGGSADWSAAVQLIHRLARNRDPMAKRQLKLIEQMKLDAKGFPVVQPVVKVLKDSPQIVTVRRLLNKAECEYLVDKAVPLLQPSVVIDPATGRSVPNPIRKSRGTAFGVYQEDLVVRAINCRISAATETKPVQGEPLQILAYGPGDEYRNHLDALPATDNQRVITALVYLNDSYAGGETYFPHLDFAFRGEQGDALIFANVGAAGTPDPFSEHAGQPVKSGTKFIASRWIRQHPFTFPPPHPIIAA